MSFIPASFLLVFAASFEVELHRVPAPHFSHWGRDLPSALVLLQDSPLRNYVNVSLTQMQYSGDLYVGSPPQRFSLIFDTGSSWTWVVDAACGLNCHPSATFDPSQSSSFAPTGQNITVRYGKGYLEGYLAFESVALFPSEGGVTKQAILLAEKNAEMQGMKADGILVSARQGLSFSKLSRGYQTVVETLKVQGVIKSASFAIYLSDFTTQSPRYSSSISFGEYDLLKYAISDFTYIDVIQHTGHWAVPLTAFAVAGNEYVRNGIAIIDSGTSLIVVPSDIFASIRDFFCVTRDCFQTHSRLIVFSCNKTDVHEFPDLEISLGGHDFPLPSEAYMLFIEEKEMGGGVCVVMLHPLQFNVWILGDVFMRRYYTMFDMDGLRVGLAKSVNNLKTGAWWWIAAAAAVGVGAAIGCFWWMRKKHNNEELGHPLLSDEASR